MKKCSFIFVFALVFSFSPQSFNLSIFQSSNLVHAQMTEQQIADQEAKAFIKKRQIQIEQLTRDIGLKTKTIKSLEEKMNRGKESLAAIIRSTNELDSYSLA